MDFSFQIGEGRISWYHCERKIMKGEENKEENVAKKSSLTKAQEQRNKCFFHNVKNRINSCVKKLKTWQLPELIFPLSHNTLTITPYATLTITPYAISWPLLPSMFHFFLTFWLSFFLFLCSFSGVYTLENPPPWGDISWCHLVEKIWNGEEKKVYRYNVTQKREERGKRKKGKENDKWELKGWKKMQSREELRQKGHDRSRKNDVSREGGKISFS